MFTRARNLILLLIILVSVFLTIPNFISTSSLPSILNTYRFQLGLDLQGGSMIVLQVDESVVKKDYANSISESIKQTFRSNQIFYSSIGVNNNQIVVAVEPSTETEKVLTTLKSIERNNLDVAKNGSVYTVTITEDAIAKRVVDALTQSMEIVRNRVDQTGTKEPVIQRQGESRINLELPGVEDPSRIKDLLGRTAKMNFHIVSTSSNAVAMAGVDGAVYKVDREPVMSGDNLSDAQVTFENNAPVVAFRFNSSGGKRFAEITSQNVGKQLAIVMDNQVISAPRINQTIAGGNGIITGSFSTREAQDLALLMRAGSLPAPLSVVEERRVGPALGNDSIKSGTLSVIIGLIAVCIFMAIFYRTLGIVANLSLVINGFIIMALMSLLGSTLTLPGIAGIVLTLGMAVDANVLIYEGMYMETREKGGSVATIIKNSFDRVFSTILDSNLTTFFAALFLYIFGSGPVKGFAVTLTIGLVASVISALMFSRSVIEFISKFNMVNIKRKIRLVDPKINFMKYHMIGFVISGVILVAGIVSFFYPGPNFGIDFKGGVSLDVQISSNYNISDLRSALSEIELNDLTIQSSSNNTYKVRFKAVDNAYATETVNKIKAKLWKDTKYLSNDFVGPSVSKELLLNGIYAIVLSMLAIMVYLWVRFEWQFGLAGVISLLHDVIGTMFFVIITKSDFNLNTIAALMTIAGYSINDTVVIFDQVRRNIRIAPERTLRENINISINQALRRTINTTSTVFLVVLILYLFGGEALKSLSFALLIGTLLGVYSTIFIATPLLLYFGTGRIAIVKDKKSAKLEEGYGEFESYYQNKVNKLTAEDKKNK